MNDVTRAGLESALGAHYSLGRELGGGGMSRVFVAHDSSLDRDVVAKVLSPALAQEFSLERFTREIKLAAGLQHAHIVPLLTAGVTTDGLPYYLMPFVEGESLRHRLRDGASLSIADTMLVLKDVSRALAYAHARGVVHRDIKPDNVMLSGGAAVVTDFGIAKAMSQARERDVTPDSTDSLTRMGTSIGTPSYMAPEQGAGDPDTDHRADIYAFGAMAYELLAGVTPFGDRPPHALLVAHFTETPRDLHDRRPDVPPGLADLVMRCLAKDPANRPQHATDVLHALDEIPTTGVHTIPPALATGTSRDAASAHVPPTGVRPQPRNRRRLGIAIAVAAAVGAASYATYRALAAPRASDATMIAVLPFNVRDEGLMVWREGLVDVLSRSLDGAGALRTAAPSATISRAGARVDAASAASVGRAIGAGLVLFGDLSADGRDSVHLRVALYDVASGRVRSNIDVKGEASRMDALADSLSLRVLRELGSSGGQGGSRLYTVGTQSLPALKAFLQGQQYYRRSIPDSARAAFEAAVELDSTFSLAWRGIAAMYIRVGQENDPAAQHALDLAIRYKSGRSPRDSLLLQADSLRLAVVRRSAERADVLDSIPHLSRLFTTLETATRHYPNDAELWFELGDAGYHFGELAGVRNASALAWFERGIALDSTFVVPYFHAFSLALRTGDTRGASAFARRASLLYSPPLDGYYRLLALATESVPLSAAARSLIDSVPAQYTTALIGELANSPDSTGIALSLARDMFAKRGSLRSRDDSTSVEDAMTLALAARGHFREVMTSHINPLPPSQYFQLVRFGAISRDSALGRAREWSRTEPTKALSAARLLAEARDTSSLALLLRWADSTDTANRARANVRVRYAPVLLAYATFARGDTAAALRAFLAIPMSYCGGTPCAGALVAELLVRAGRDRDALRVLDRWLASVTTNPLVVPELLQRAQLAEKTGDAATAALGYRTVMTRWNDGDPVTASAVQAARAGFARVRGR